MKSLQRDSTTSKTFQFSAYKIEQSYLNFYLGQRGEQSQVELRLHQNEEPLTHFPMHSQDPTSSPPTSSHWISWDVSSFKGKMIDLTLSGYDELLQSTEEIQALIVQSNACLTTNVAEQVFEVRQNYLHLPVRVGAKPRRMRFLNDEKISREFSIEYDAEQPDFWVFADLSSYLGKSLTVQLEFPTTGCNELAALKFSNQQPNAAGLYKEPQRPQFHFTSKRGWLNDPNGLTYFEGKYHLFYQHNPFGWSWGNMHWGYATSDDLLHWEEQPTGLYPPRPNDWCFSGSGFVDKGNQFQLATGDKDVFCLAYTSTARGEVLAYRQEGEEEWHNFEGNPILQHEGRDPKVFWHAETARWVMVVYNEDPLEERMSLDIHSSADLRTWNFESRLDGFYECPDLFELPIDDNETNTKWVIHGADGRYLLGEFDGKTFTPDSNEKQSLWYGDVYAGQTFSDTPDGRRIQICWGRGIDFPGMPFNQQMSLPIELSLRSTKQGTRLIAEPIRESKTLRQRELSWHNLTLQPEEEIRLDLHASTFELNIECNFNTAEEIIFEVCGVPIIYDASRQELRCLHVFAPLNGQDNRIKLQLFVDRGSFEIFGNQGEVALAIAVQPQAANPQTVLSTRGGTALIDSLTLHELSSVWTNG